MSVRSGEDELLISYLPILVRAGGLTDWERGFCASLIKRERKVPLRLSSSQRWILIRLVDDFKNRGLRT